jgi:ubiquinone/menaquinone biosynthesis C-methylase UbiE
VDAILAEGRADPHRLGVTGGSYGGFLTAWMVGHTQRYAAAVACRGVYDMTAEMLERARANATAAGLDNVEFREGRLESLPVADASVDAVTSNCVVNLVPDKSAVFREIHRVLRPGGRLVIADILLDGELPAAIATDVFAWVGCVAGAMERTRYFALLEEAGLRQVEVLRDVDYLAATGGDDPAELRDVMAAAGITTADIAGVVHSVTFRAVKPLADARASR